MVGFLVVPGFTDDVVTGFSRVTAGFSVFRVGWTLSVFFARVGGLDRAFGQLRARGQELIVFRVLDPAEVDFPFERASLFEDLETGQTFYVDPQTARAEYRERFDEHQRGLERLAGDHGVDFVPWTTDRPLVECLFEYVNARMRRGRSVLRRAAAGGRR